MLCSDQWRSEAKSLPGPTLKVLPLLPLKFAFKNLKRKTIMFRVYLNLALGKKRCLSAFIVTCTLGLAVAGLCQGCSGVGAARTLFHYIKI